MNKVFKVIWSEARNAYVVVSEIAKNHGSKSCSTKKLLAMLIATGVMTCASMAPAMAADPPAEALKHSTVTNGANITVTEDTNKDGGKEYKVALNNDITLEGDTDDFVSISGSKGTIWATGSVIVGSGVDGSVVMDGTTATVSGLGNTTTAYNGFANGKGKAATEEQLKEVATEAGKHSVVTEGANITVTPEQAEDGRMQYNVALKNDIKLAGDNDYTYVNISGSKGSVWASSSVAAGNVIMDGTTATVSGLGNTTTAYDGFATTGKAATEEQLKEVATEAGKHTQVKAGTNVSVVPGETADGTHVYTVNADGTTVSGDSNVVVTAGAKDVNNVTNYGVKLNKDLKGIESVSNGSAKLALNGTTGIAGIINGQGASVYMQGSTTVINSKISVDKDGKISGVAAGKISADSTDAVNGSQLNAVATEAGKHSKVVNGNNTNVEETTVDGQKVYKVNLNNNIMVGDVTGKYVSISGTNGTIEATGAIATKDRVYADKGAKLADIDVTGNTISNGGATLTLGAMGGMVSEFANGQGASVKLFGDATIINGKVNVYNDGRIAGVAAGINDNDAVNVGQLKEAVEAGNTDTHIKPGEYGVGADNTVNMDVVDKNGNKVDTVTIKDVAKASDVGDVNNIASDIKNQDGSHTTVVDAVNNLNNKVGDLQYSKVEKGEIEDGDSTTTAIGKLDQKLTDVAATAAKHTKVEGSSNITVTNTAKEGEAANYKVELNKDIDVDTVTANSVTTGQTVMNNDGLKVGKDVSVTATAVTAGKTSISDEGVKVGDKTYISADGLNANGHKITNVADGKENSDAVNVGQLKESEKTINNRIDGVENQVVNNTNRINKLGSRVNKVGAGAAALAALHPMDFDPDDKLTFSAGYGNYGGENAAAIGAYYRPDEKVMFSVAGTVGNGENMVNAGVSFALDRTNHVSNSRTALAREVIDLRGQLAVMGAKMAKMEKAFGMLDETKTKLFPDVPANHWAYEYIAKLAGNGYIEGYPDGNFGGDRLMTRYEFAAMLYRAIENGAALEEKIIKEFEPELGRIRVDRISGQDGDRDKIERVRVNDTKGERDHYGNKLAK